MTASAEDRGGRGQVLLIGALRTLGAVALLVAVAVGLRERRR